MKKIISSIVFFAPALALAQDHTVLEVNGLVTWILTLFNTLIYLFVAAAVVFIVWNIFNYVIKPPTSDDKRAALINVGWGILGLAIIVSVWGLVGIITRSFVTTPPNTPIPNIGNSTRFGGLPANQIPGVQ